MGKRLVRDDALSNWRVPGAEHQVRPVRDDAEHIELLRQKLLEECGEVIFAADRAELVKEISDVLSVLVAFAWKNGIGWGEVVEKRGERDMASGGFIRGMVWETDR